MTITNVNRLKKTLVTNTINSLVLYDKTEQKTCMVRTNTVKLTDLKDDVSGIVLKHNNKNLQVISLKTIQNDFIPITKKRKTTSKNDTNHVSFKDLASKISCPKTKYNTVELFDLYGSLNTVSGYTHLNDAEVLNLIASNHKLFDKEITIKTRDKSSYYSMLRCITQEPDKIIRDLANKIVKDKTALFVINIQYLNVSRFTNLRPLCELTNVIFVGDSKRNYPNYLKVLLDFDQSMYNELNNDNIHDSPLRNYILNYLHCIIDNPIIIKDLCNALKVLIKLAQFKELEEIFNYIYLEYETELKQLNFDLQKIKNDFSNTPTTEYGCKYQFTTNEFDYLLTLLDFVKTLQNYKNTNIIEISSDREKSIFNSNYKLTPLYISFLKYMKKRGINYLTSYSLNKRIVQYDTTDNFFDRYRQPLNSTTECTSLTVFVNSLLEINQVDFGIIKGYIDSVKKKLKTNDINDVKLLVSDNLHTFKNYTYDNIVC